MFTSLQADAPTDVITLLCQLPYLSQALYVAAQLGIADLVADGPKTSEELAAEAHAQEPSLDRILRPLCKLGLFEEVQPHRFALTSRGASLRSDAPNSQRAYILFYCDPVMWHAATHLIHAVTTGQAAWEHAFEMPLFEHLGANPQFAAVFNAGMSDGMRQRQRALLSYDFSDIRILIDVGGNQGRLLATALQANPHLQGVLFDRPEVVATAYETVEQAGVTDRCEIVSGDFFQDIPTGGDAYLLSVVIHDWEDEPAVQILQRCRRVIRANGTLLLLERVLPDHNELTIPVLTDLVMLMIGGRERTEAEYRALLSQADFALASVRPSDSGFCLLEASPR